MAETNSLNSYENSYENMTIPKFSNIGQNATVPSSGYINSNATIPQSSGIGHNATSTVPPKKQSKESGDSFPLPGIGILVLLALAAAGFFIFKTMKIRQKREEQCSEMDAPQKFSENDRRLLNLMTALDKLIKLT